MIVINRAEILNTIARECHYDSGDPIEAYSKLLSLINNYEGTEIVSCKDCKYHIVSPDFSCCKLTEAIVGEDDFCSKGARCSQKE